MAEAVLTENQKRVLWFVRVRWVAIAVIFLIVFCLKYLGQYNFPIIAPLIITLIPVAYNVLYPFLTARYPVFSESQFFTYLRASIDLLLVTVLIHFTGGVESPFELIYMVELIAVSLFGFRIISYALALQSSLFYLTALLLEWTVAIPHYLPGQLYSSLFVNYGYIFSKSLALFASLLLLVYLTAYLADRLKEKEKKIEKLSDARLDFMNEVIHEVKIPLTSIIGYTSLLDKENLGPVNDAQKGSLEVIDRQSHRILAMVNDLLNLARLESRKVKFEFRTISLAEIADHAVEEAGPLLDARKLTLTQDFDPRTPLVKVDESKIHEVFTNLLSNAIKFSNDSGHIFISIIAGTKEVTVSVRDEGMGIDQIDIPHIFDKFYRASKESLKKKGTGLGLAISKFIIEAHGGRLWVTSPGIGQGAVFYFTLPL